jgi:N-sulfoglucosamine sulfohydrolase
MKTKSIVASIILSVVFHSSHACEKPNIVVFIADDLGWEESSPYGNPNIYTPNIQKLADEGIRFDNFYLTASSCSPSRSSLLSGLYPHNTGAMNLNEDMKPDILLFPELLRDAGYYTMLIGKSHGTNNPEIKAKFDVLQKADWNKPWIMGDMWLTAIKESPKEKPFFLWAASIDPHYPFYQGEHPHKHKPEDVVLPPYYPNIPEMREELAAYYDEIGRFDQHVGMVISELEKQGILDNTLIFILSDNGRPFPQAKTRVNKQGLKSPFIVWYPKLIKPSATQSLASAIDLAPTILDICNIEKPEVMPGESLLPTFKNPDVEIRRYAFGEHNWHVFKAFERCVITKEHIYIKNWLPHLPNLPVGENQSYPSVQKMKAMYDSGILKDEYADCFVAPRPGEELFDVVKDSHCMNNLASRKKSQKVLNQFQNALTVWMQETNDIFPGEYKLKKDKIDRKRYGKDTTESH